MIRHLAAAAVLSAGFCTAAVALSPVLPKTPDSFPVVVSYVLGRQTNGAISKLHGRAEQAAIHCTNDVLRGLPMSDKAFVLRGTSYVDRRHRLGVVLRMHNSEWKDRVVRSCGGIGKLT